MHSKLTSVQTGLSKRKTGPAGLWEGLDQWNVQHQRYSFKYFDLTLITDRISYNEIHMDTF